jgi:hypothetical protein
VLVETLILVSQGIFPKSIGTQKMSFSRLSDGSKTPMVATSAAPMLKVFGRPERGGGCVQVECRCDP